MVFAFQDTEAGGPASLHHWVFVGGPVGAVKTFCKDGSLFNFQGRGREMMEVVVVVSLGKKNNQY